MKTLLFAIFLNTLILVINSENSCGQVCGSRVDCLRLCCDSVLYRSKLSFELPHCGLRYFKDMTQSYRVIGGEDSEPFEFPWAVSLQIRYPLDWANNNWRHYCGGSILNERFILTTGNCVTEILEAQDRGKEVQLRIVYGTNNLLDPKAKVMFPALRGRYPYLILHEDYYDSGVAENDIALIKTEIPFKFIISNTRFPVNSICLPERSSEPKGWATIAGWGSLVPFAVSTHNYLQKADIEIINRRDCNLLWKYSMWNNNMFVPPASDYPVDYRMICAVGDDMKGASKGDSGGSLIQLDGKRAKVIGIASFGPIPSKISELYNVPTVYTLISRYTDWIESQISLHGNYGKLNSIGIQILSYYDSSCESEEYDYSYDTEYDYDLDYE